MKAKQKHDVIKQNYDDVKAQLQQVRYICLLLVLCATEVAAEQLFDDINIGDESHILGGFSTVSKIQHQHLLTLTPIVIQVSWHFF